MAGDSTTDSPSTSPNKRLKITIPNPNSIIQNEPGNNHQREQQQQSADYDDSDTERCKITIPNPNSIIQNEPGNNHQREQQQSADYDDSDTERCGICLSEGGKRAIRGKIDSCSHFFCFVCIMEWAKVESRCPMCKRRFTVIHRPPKEGVFASERVVKVPQRDQVHHLFGNATSGPFDPYAEAKCSVCHGIADESLLLLCDLCDSAAHTYCVGLGATVPDGDWFCHDCALSRSEHDKTELDTDTDDQIISANSSVKLPAETSFSIFDIVRETNIPRFRGHNASVPSLPNHTPPSISPGSESSGADEIGCRSERRRNIVGNSTQSGARTLHRCRNVHSRIRALRENWHALQSRSLSFSSNMVESGGGSCRKGKVAAVFNYRSGESQSSSSTNEQSTSQGNFIEPKGDVCDVDKAWKMMNIAKSMQKKCMRTSSLNQTSKKLSCFEGASKESINSSGVHISKIQQKETGNGERTGKQKRYSCYYLEREKEKHESREMERQKRMVMNIESSERVLTSCSPRFFQSPSSTKVQTQNGCQVNKVEPFFENVQDRCRESLSSANTEGRPSCSTSLVGSRLQGSIDSRDSNLEVGVPKLDRPEGKTRLEKSCSKSKDAKDDNVKSEIQTLVKLNLKLLSKDKKLGVDAFKEIARLATHTILAACGFPHSKSTSIHSFPTSVCSHTEDIKLRYMSSLMPNSCRECFYVFVKNVVFSIMIEKGHSEPI
ncbi:hypothetical protein DITRI_Ditri04bG0036200 [Diplodiscus trichospermus]